MSYTTSQTLQCYRFKKKCTNTNLPTECNLVKPFVILLALLEIGCEAHWPVVPPPVRTKMVVDLVKRRPQKVTSGTEFPDTPSSDMTANIMMFDLDLDLSTGTGLLWIQEAVPTMVTGAFHFISIERNVRGETAFCCQKLRTTTILKIQQEGCPSSPHHRIRSITGIQYPSRTSTLSMHFRP